MSGVVLVLSRFRFAMRVRRIPKLQAEAWVISYGLRCTAFAREQAADPLARDERRAHCGVAALIARRRQDFLNSLDTGPKFIVVT